MSSKSRLSRLALRIESRAHQKKSSDFFRRFRAAWERGLILCRDGKTRTHAEWLATLPENLRNQIKEITNS